MMDMTLDDYGCVEPYSRGMAFLKQDVGHMKKVREFEAREAKLEALLLRAKQALLLRAKQALRNGDDIERLDVAEQISFVIDAQASQV